MKDRLYPGECRICDAAHNDPLDEVSEQENDIHESEHVPPSTAHYLRSTGRVVRLNGSNRWVERERLVTKNEQHAEVRIEPSGHLTSCEPSQYDSDCPACRSSLVMARAEGREYDPFDRMDALLGEMLSLEDKAQMEQDLQELGVPTEAITDEAYRLVMGDRQSSYSHPSQDFRATGRQWGALIENWLRSEGYSLMLGSTQQYGPVDFPDIPPRIVALMMTQLKLSRESHRPKRDNRVDAIGYVLCADRVVEGY